MVWRGGGCVVALLVLVAGMADLHAAKDEMTLRSGQSFDGIFLNPLEKEPKVYRFRTSDGILLTIAVEQVKDIEHTGEEASEYRQLCEDAEDTAAGNFRMAQWCGQHRHEAHQKAHYERVLELDPEHAEARRALGYSKMVDGQWRTQEQEMAAQGKVRYRGKWVTRQEAAQMERRKSQQAEVADMTRKIAKWVRDLNTPRDAEAREQLGSLRDPVAVPGLLQALEKESAPGVRLALVRALGRIGVSDAIAPLLVLAVDDPAEAVRAECLEILRVHRGKAVTEYFIGRLSPKRSKNEEINRAAYVLGELGDGTAVSPLIEALTTTHKYQVTTGGNPGQTSAGMGRSGTGGNVGGLQMGNSVKIMSRQISNPEVYTALKKLTGQNYYYDQPAWRGWYDQQNHGE